MSGGVAFVAVILFIFAVFVVIALAVSGGRQGQKDISKMSAPYIYNPHTLEPISDNDVCRLANVGTLKQLTRGVLSSLIAQGKIEISERSEWEEKVRSEHGVGRNIEVRAGEFMRAKNSDPRWVSDDGNAFLSSDNVFEIGHDFGMVFLGYNWKYFSENEKYYKTAVEAGDFLRNEIPTYSYKVVSSDDFGNGDETILKGDILDEDAKKFRDINDAIAAGEVSRRELIKEGLGSKVFQVALQSAHIIASKHDKNGVDENYATWVPNKETSYR